MKRRLCVKAWRLWAAATVCGLGTLGAAEAYRALPLKTYRDKMVGGWLGQMAGVGWGGPTEFRWQGKIIPEEKLPKWKPEMINQFHQDDIYVEMTFLRTLELYGWDVSIRQAGIDFANSRYPLWHANNAGRENLRAGIAPPDSGHPKFNRHADDIDYQIEADYAGLICPGLPQAAIELGEKFGRLMNYGDGLYGGQFISGMYAAAFFETNVEKVVRAGLACIPHGSQYAEAVRDVLRWHRQYPEDWTRTWQEVERKYHHNPAYRRFSCSGPDSDFDIDAKINGAYVVIGLLYGGGDLERTIKIATRCGQDSDCNPSSAGGVVGTILGRSGIPKRFVSALDTNAVFSHTAYNFAKLTAVCERLARQAVLRYGGRVASEPEETFLIPAQRPKPSPLEQCWAPGPPLGVRYTPEEAAKIRVDSAAAQLRKAFSRRFPGWRLVRCGRSMDPGLRAKFRGRRNVFLTHPVSEQVPCVMAWAGSLAGARRPVLRLVCAHDPRGDWELAVRVNGKEILRTPVGPDTAKEGWLEKAIDLSPWAGQDSVKIEVWNAANGWRYEAAYWAELRVAR